MKKPGKLAPGKLAKGKLAKGKLAKGKLARGSRLRIDEQKLRALWATTSLPDLAAAFHVSINTLYRRAGELDLPTKMSLRAAAPRRSRAGEYAAPEPAPPRPRRAPNVIPSIPLSRLMAGR